MIISGKFVGNRIVFNKQAIEELYNTSYYGRPREDTLELTLIEGAYLIYSKKIKVELEGKELDFKSFFQRASSMIKNFELFYIVYKDLRERGYFVQPSVTGFRIYPRGGHPGKTPAEFFIFVTSERIPLMLSDLRRYLGTADNLKKRLVLAIVDEESDITFYEAKKTRPSGSCRLNFGRSLATATLLEDRVIVWDADASQSLHEKGFFGKPMDEGHLQLSLVESCYLLKNGILEIEYRDNMLDFPGFSHYASRIESDFPVKYAVYEELRNNGLVPKTGYKFGTHYRVYRNFESPKKTSHSDYLVHAVEHDHVFSLQQLSRSVRLANSVRKEMIYGDINSQVEFFIIGRMRL